MSSAPWDGREEITALGRLDATNSPAFLRMVRVLVDRGARTVIVDLRGAELHTSGTEALTTAQRLLHRCGGEIVLKAPRARTLRLLREARLTDRFPVCW